MVYKMYMDFLGNLSRFLCTLELAEAVASIGGRCPIEISVGDRCALELGQSHGGTVLFVGLLPRFYTRFDGAAALGSRRRNRVASVLQSLLGDEQRSTASAETLVAQLNDK